MFYPISVCLFSEMIGNAALGKKSVLFTEAYHIPSEAKTPMAWAKKKKG
jgi:hypothetical protein